MFLGYFYKDRNLNKVAQEYFEKAVNLGCGSAAYAIAEMLDSNLEVIFTSTYEQRELTEEEKHIPAEVVKWYFKAAQLGHKTSMEAISLFYKLGVVVEKNEQLAEQWRQIEEISSNAVNEYKRTI